MPCDPSLSRADLYRLFLSVGIAGAEFIPTLNLNGFCPPQTLSPVIRITITPMSTSTPVTHVLDHLGIPYQIHIHKHPPKSIEIAARERGLDPCQIIRSLLFRMEGDQYVLVLIAAGSRVRWSKLRRYLNISRVSTATAEEVLQATGYEPGAVSPFGLPTPIRILADRSLLDHAVLSIGAGIPNAGVILARDDLIRVLDLEIGDFG